MVYPIVDLSNSEIKIFLKRSFYFCPSKSRISSLRGQDHFFILQMVLPLENLEVYGKLLKGHRAQDQVQQRQ